MAANLIGKNIKDNSRRRFTGGGARPDRAADRRASAEVRNARWAALSPRQKLAELDARLGSGIGATKQRAALSRAA